MLRGFRYSAGYVAGYSNHVPFRRYDLRAALPGQLCDGILRFVAVASNSSQSSSSSRLIPDADS